MLLNIIHLNSRADRMSLLREQLSFQGISAYRIWDGVVNEECVCTGISQAHKNVVRQAKELELAEVLIAEDDLCFTAKGAFKYYLENKPLNFDIYLSGICYGEIKKDNSVDEFIGTTLYMVQRNFYDKFLLLPENRHLDRALKNLGRFIVCNPFVARPYNGFSDNMKQYMNYDFCFRDRTLYRG